MKGWNAIFSLLKEFHDRDMRQRSIAARNREVPKMRKILGMRESDDQNRSS